MAQKRRPGSAGTLHGTSKHTLALSGAAYHKKQFADDEAISDACREALADASHKTQANASAEQLKALPDVVAGGDGLFSGTDQTLKLGKQQ
jgi:hypothetical protein